MNHRVQTTDWARPLYEPHRYKVLYGGRYGLKSWQMARALVLLGATRPLDIVCAREHQNSIADSAKRTLEIQIDQCGLNRYYDVRRDFIHGKNGTHFIFKGLEANRDNIRGWESKDIVWVTEANRMSHETAKVLVPTIRKPGSEIWFDFNPQNRYDWVWTRFGPGAKTRPGWFIRKVNYLDAPRAWLSDEIMHEIEDFKRHNPEAFPHVYLGEPDDLGQEKKVLPYRACESAVAQYRPEYVDGPGIAGLDVADSPVGDWNAFVVRRGPVITHVERWRAPDLGVTARRALRLCREHGVTLMYYDAGGLGVGVKAVLAEMDPREVEGVTVRPELFNGSVKGPKTTYQHKVKNRDFFARRGSQLWWAPKIRSELLARAAEPERCIYIADDAVKGMALETYLAKLAQPVWDSERGKMRVDKDPDGAGSPDEAEATALAFASDSMNGLRAA